jgi:hypothetical protein
MHQRPECIDAIRDIGRPDVGETIDGKLLDGE